jgi:hypothetical protein
MSVMDARMTSPVIFARTIWSESQMEPVRVSALKPLMNEMESVRTAQLELSAAHWRWSITRLNSSHLNVTGLLDSSSRMVNV